MRRFLSDAEKQKIEACVAEVEGKVASEIVPVIVGTSDSYPAAGWTIGVCLMILTGLACVLIFPHWEPWWTLSAELAALIIGLELAQVPAIRRLALHWHTVDTEVRQRAMQAFLELNVHTTEERTGVLVFVSMLERRAVILSDIGIGQKADAEDWKRIVDQLANDIRQGDLTEALCRAIRATGELVRSHFPTLAHGKSKNELSNSVVVDQE